jgi:MFS family permease
MFAFIKRNFRWIAGGFTLTYFSTFGQTYFISASVAEWQAAFGLSHGEFGRLYMFATLASALCLPFLGRIVDVVRVPTTIVLVVPILAAASLMAGLASSVTTLVVAIFVLRLFGQGMMTHIALTATGRWFFAERGRAVSLVILGHQTAEATIPLAFAALSLAYGYRMGWIAGTVALLLIGLPFSLWAYSQPRVPQAKSSTTPNPVTVGRNWTRAEVLRDPIFWVLLTGVLAPAFIGTTIFYHQNYLTALNDWPPQFFAMALMVMAGTTIVCALTAGALIDRFSARAMLPLFLSPLAGACFLLAYSGAAATLLLVMLLLGISYGIASTLFGSLWPETYGVLNLGGIRAITVSAQVLASAAGPGITGTLIDLDVALPTQMVFLGGYCVLATAAMVVASGYLRRRAKAVPGI